MRSGRSPWKSTALFLMAGIVAALVTAGSASAAIEKVFFRDENYALSWNNADMAAQISEYLSNNGFTQVDADEFREFCLRHIQARDTSVVVMVNDVLPDTVMDPIGDTGTEPNVDCVFNQYLKAGGKVIYLFDWPGYYLGTPGVNVTWNDTGAAAALGFWPCRWNGQTDNNTAIVFTEEGQKWGLTKPWQTKRAANPLTDIDIILGTPGNRTDSAVPWVKTYVLGRPGAGFVYLYDLPAGDAANGGNPPVVDPFGEEDLAQIVAVANYFPAGEVALTANVTVNVRETTGKSVAGLRAVITDAAGNALNVPLTDAGTFTLAAAPGTYTLRVEGNSLDTPATTTIEVANTDVTANVDVTLLPFVLLTTADGIDWKLFSYLAEGDPDVNAEAAEDYAPAQPNFNDSSWEEVAVPANHEVEVGYNTYFWYRAHFTIPEALKAYRDRYLVIDNFNIDDNDETFINGVKVGAFNGWNTLRQWVIDPSIINWDGDNVVAIKGYQGTGGAGMNATTAGPRLRVGAASSGQVKGKAVITATEPASGVTITLSAAGQTTLSTTTEADGTYSFSFVPVGSWSVSATGKHIARTNPAAAPVTVQGAKVNTVPDVEILFKALPEFSTVVDKAVYYDEFYSTGWLNQEESEIVRDYFEGKGYTVLNADELAEFMQAHVTSKVPSVVVAARDIFPDTVVDVSSGAVVKNNLINDYMNAGGRIVQFRDIPFYNIALSEGGNLTAADNGSITILGFSAGGGPRDILDTTVLSVYGKALGLTATWPSQRPAQITDVDVPLSTGRGGATSWIKFYPDSNGPGMFIYLLDCHPDQVAMSDAFLADAQKLAEASGVISGPGIDTGAPPPPPPGVKGDVDGNGQVAILDVVTALRIVAGLVTATPENLAGGDLNGNGRIEITEVVQILRAVAGLGTL